MQSPESIIEALSSGSGERRATALAELLQSDVDPAPYLNKVSVCLLDAFPPVRFMALAVCARCGDAASGPLASALDPGQPDSIRAAAAAILAGLGPAAADAIRGLCRGLTSDSETLRNASSIALARIGESSVPSLKIMLQFSRPETVEAAVEALAVIGPPAASAAPELEALAARSPLPFQLACIAALARITGDPERGMPEIVNALEHEDPVIRKTAAEKIAMFGVSAHPVLPKLLRCMEDPDSAVRAVAVISLGRLQAPPDRVVTEVVPCLGDHDAEVRYAAAVVLAGYGADAKSAIPALKERLQDPVEKVSMCARSALEMIAMKEK
jgi:HEAT repeat protein